MSTESSENRSSSRLRSEPKKFTEEELCAFEKHFPTIRKIEKNRERMNRNENFEEETGEEDQSDHEREQNSSENKKQRKPSGKRGLLVDTADFPPVSAKKMKGQQGDAGQDEGSGVAEPEDHGVPERALQHDEIEEVDSGEYGYNEEGPMTFEQILMIQYMGQKMTANVLKRWLTSEKFKEDLKMAMEKRFDGVQLLDDLYGSSVFSEAAQRHLHAELRSWEGVSGEIARELAMSDALKRNAKNQEDKENVENPDANGREASSSHRSNEVGDNDEDEDEAEEVDSNEYDFKEGVESMPIKQVLMIKYMGEKMTAKVLKRWLAGEQFKDDLETVDKNIFDGGDLLDDLSSGLCCAFNGAAQDHLWAKLRSWGGVSEEITRELANQDALERDAENQEDEENGEDPDANGTEAASSQHSNEAGNYDEVEEEAEDEEEAVEEEMEEQESPQQPVNAMNDIKVEVVENEQRPRAADDVEEEEEDGAEDEEDLKKDLTALKKKAREMCRLTRRKVLSICCLVLSDDYKEDYEIVANDAEYDGASLQCAVFGIYEEHPFSQAGKKALIKFLVKNMNLLK